MEARKTETKGSGGATERCTAEPGIQLLWPAPNKTALPLKKAEQKLYHYVWLAIHIRPKSSASRSMSVSLSQAPRCTSTISRFSLPPRAR